MLKLIAIMRRGSSTGIAGAWARYDTIDAARVGTASLLRDDRILRDDRPRREAGRGGVLLMIPGVFEPRPGRSPVASTDGVPRVWPPVPRSAVRRRTILETVWRYVMRPTDTPPMQVEA